MTKFKSHALYSIATSIVFSASSAAFAAQVVLPPPPLPTLSPEEQLLDELLQSIADGTNQTGPSISSPPMPELLPVPEGATPEEIQEIARYNYTIMIQYEQGALEPDGNACILCKNGSIVPSTVADPGILDDNLSGNGGAGSSTDGSSGNSGSGTSGNSGSGTSGNDTGSSSSGSGASANSGSGSSGSSSSGSGGTENNSGSGSAGAPPTMSTSSGSGTGYAW